ncbi:MAG: dihydrolipoyl dehydrogenase [Deltaproteobacteria bacterium]|nr:dihydrolipoyl dehydrogenase [Deltaproteobacteria bacterium]
MYDALVIGGGPGGYAAAIRLAQLGAKAALIEAGEMGGTCVNFGCIPTKVWQRAAALMHSIKSAEDFGVQAEFKGLDLQALNARKAGVAKDIRMGMGGLLQNNGVEVIRGRALLKNPTEVEVQGQIVTGSKIILATGSSLDIPDIPGLEEAGMTTNQLLDSTTLPSSLLIWGAGPIEVEIASILSIFGVKIHLITPSARILPQEDSDTSQRIAQSLREFGVELLTRRDLVAVKPVSGGHEAVLSGAEEKTVTVDRVLISGRRPNTAGLGLERVGIQLNADSGIKVNDRLETSISGIYAIGDCTGGWLLSHAASAMAIAAAENVMGQNKKFPFNLVPRGIWTVPEVGAVGLSEEEAEKQGFEVESGSFPYAINGLAMCRGELAGAAKIVNDANTGEILGVHIVGAQATEVIGEAALAMQLECTVKELARGIRVHPTFSEAVVDSARDAASWALYLPKR